MTFRTTTRTLVAGAAVLTALTLDATLTLGATAQAAPGQLLQFRSPSGNITCQFTTAIGGGDTVVCDIADHSFTSPQRPAWCDKGRWGDTIALTEGGTPAFSCAGPALAADGLPTLYFDHSTTVGTLTCLSMPNGITCTDKGAGHTFHIAREFYGLS
ncbi:DUF6636 domain-containing protein [Nocardia heshunensis]